MNMQYEKSVRGRFFPQPRNLSLKDGFRLLDDAVPVEISGHSGETMIVEAFVKYWNAGAVVRQTGNTVGDLMDEAYRITVLPEVIRLETGSETALHYALLTLRQMAETERGVPGKVRYMLPCCEIADAPACHFRGMHFCIFPESTPDRIETQIRMAAYCKFNYIILEPWGVFPFQSHQKVGWEECKWSRETFAHLLQVADECKITLIPQLNLFGHASFSRAGCAKHAVLDFAPEWEPLYEPGGWSYCLSNMETRKILTDLVLELYEFFGKPRFFHIGCDEAYDFQTCAACAATPPEKLLLEHLQYFHDLLAERNCRIIMWHDMLLRADDPRWQNCIAFGDDRTGRLLEKLPRDIVIADWQYGKTPEEVSDFEWPTANFLKETGFDVLLCPWLEESGVYCSGAQVAKRGHFGFLETTWNLIYQKDFSRIFIASSAAAWGGAVQPVGFDDTSHVAFTRNLRHVHRDMGISRYYETGHTNHQILVPDFQN